MYSQFKNEFLVTIPTDIKSNLAIQFSDDIPCAESFCVIHDGFINYIPNTKVKKSKYVPVSKDKRGTGKIYVMQWIKLDNETLFVTLSDLGLHIFEEGLSDIRYFFDIQNFTKEKCKPIGCTVSKDILFVGLDNDRILSFSQRWMDYNILNSVDCIFHSFSGLADSYIVTDYLDRVSLWETNKSGTLNLVETSTEGTIYGSNILKMFPNLIIIGDKIGMLTIFDSPKLKTLTKSKIHETTITDIDYFQPKSLLLTVSKDCNIKILKLSSNENEDFSIACIWNFENPQKLSYCGCGFLDRDVVEFCAIQLEDTVVQMFHETLNLNERSELGKSLNKKE